MLNSTQSILSFICIGFGEQGAALHQAAIKKKNREKIQKKTSYRANISCVHDGLTWLATSLVGLLSNFWTDVKISFGWCSLFQKWQPRKVYSYGVREKRPLTRIAMSKTSISGNESAPSGWECSHQKCTAVRVLPPKVLPCEISPPKILPSEIPPPRVLIFSPWLLHIFSAGKAHVLGLEHS